MNHVVWGKVSGGGRVVLPSELRRDFGIEDGAEIMFSRGEHGIEIKTLDEVIRQAQETVRRYVPAGVSLVEELREDRRRDAALE